MPTSIIHIGSYVSDIRDDSIVGVLSGIATDARGIPYGIVRVGRNSRRIKMVNLRRRFKFDPSPTLRRGRERDAERRNAARRNATVPPEIMRLAESNGLSVKEVLAIRGAPTI